MKIELLTLDKTEDRFQDYLLGTFSKELRAIPVQSLNVHQPANLVTFKILQKKDIVPPFLGMHWIQILKIRNLIMVAFPFFLTIINLLSVGQQIEWISGTLASLGAFSLLIAVNLHNDYLDHLSGLDRLHPDSRSRVIQKGWVTASQMKNWSYFYGLLGGLLGVPSLIKFPQVGFVILAVLLIGLVGLTSYKMGLRYRRWSELSVFFLLGPVLSSGLHFSFGGASLTPEFWKAIIFGTYSGLLSLFYLNIKNYEQIMVNDQARFVNTVSYLGFEKSKWFLAIFWIILVLGLMTFYLMGTELWSFLSALIISMFFSFKFLKKLFSLPSPIGSQISECCFTAKLGSLTLMVIWSIDMLLKLFQFGIVS